MRCAVIWIMVTSSEQEKSGKEAVWGTYACWYCSLTSGAQIFQKSTRYLTILGASWGIWSKFRNEKQKILEPTYKIWSHGELAHGICSPLLSVLAKQNSIWKNFSEILNYDIPYELQLIVGLMDKWKRSLAGDKNS